jgi:hypothetical protein
MKRTIGWAMTAIAGLALMSSCTKDPLGNLTEEESRIYITNRDDNANFSSYKTYSIPDSVYVVDNNSFRGGQATAWDLQALAAVRSAMARVARNQSPDLGINVTRMYNTSTNLVDLTGYWGGYGGFYDPFYWGYGGYGYGYPSAFAFVESTEAMLSVDMLDLKNAASNQTINVIWNGLVRGSGIFNSNTINNSIQALFNQSTYIKSTP